MLNSDAAWVHSVLRSHQLKRLQMSTGAADAGPLPMLSQELRPQVGPSHRDVPGSENGHSNCPSSTFTWKHQPAPRCKCAGFYCHIHQPPQAIQACFELGSRRVRGVGGLILGLHFAFASVKFSKALAHVHLRITKTPTPLPPAEDAGPSLHNCKWLLRYIVISISACSLAFKPGPQLQGYEEDSGSKGRARSEYWH